MLVSALQLVLLLVSSDRSPMGPAVANNVFTPAAPVRMPQFVWAVSRVTFLGGVVWSPVLPPITGVLLRGFALFVLKLFLIASLALTLLVLNVILITYYLMEAASVRAQLITILQASNAYSVWPLARLVPTLPPAYLVWLPIPCWGRPVLWNAQLEWYPKLSATSQRVCLAVLPAFHVQLWPLIVLIVSLVFIYTTINVWATAHRLPLSILTTPNFPLFLAKHALFLASLVYHKPNAYHAGSVTSIPLHMLARNVLWVPIPLMLLALPALLNAPSATPPPTAQAVFHGTSCIKIPVWATQTSALRTATTWQEMYVTHVYNHAWPALWLHLTVLHVLVDISIFPRVSAWLLVQKVITVMIPSAYNALLSVAVVLLQATIVWVVLVGIIYCQ